MHIDVAILGGAPIKKVGELEMDNQFLQINTLIPILPGNYDRCVVILSP
jgi:hypothetical protein